MTSKYAQQFITKYNLYSKFLATQWKAMKVMAYQKATKVWPSHSSSSEEPETCASGSASSCFGKRQSLKVPKLYSSSIAFRQASLLEASIDNCGVPKIWFIGALEGNVIWQEILPESSK